MPRMSSTPLPGPATIDDADLTGFDPFDAAIQQCPHLYYRRMQRDAPVFHVEGTDLYLVTRHDLVVPILRNTQVFSSKFGSPGEAPRPSVAERVKEVIATGWTRVPALLTNDPPEHTRLRATVAPYFTPRRIAALAEPVALIIERLIDSWIDDPSGRIEFVSRFGVPLPVEVIAHVLNVPSERMADFKRWSDDSVANIGSALADDQMLAAMRGVVELQHFLADQLELRRVEPRDDLMTDLVHAEIDDGDGMKRCLSTPEMLSMLQQILVAGNETTTKALTEGVMLLARHPEQWEALRADPAGRSPLVVEEVLRLSTPAAGMFRLATADTEIDGVPVPKGARVVLVYSAANRDPAVWGDDPDAFDPDRANHKDHLAFGKGAHFCLGAPLSRLEMQLAFEALARRVRAVRLAESNDFAYHPSFMLRGLKRLDLELEPV
jgi:cytochrome P450